jgi:signal transduction histidine kinase
VHDDAMGIHVRESIAGKSLHVGDRVSVSGIVMRGTFAPSIEPREITAFGPAPLPKPQRPSFTRIASGATDGQWLEVSGVVWSISRQEDSTPVTVLNLAVDGQRLRVLANDPPGPDASRLIDAEVRIRGVATGRHNPQRQLVEPVIRVMNLSTLEIVRPPPADAFALPLLPLNRLLGFSLDVPNPHRVRVTGKVARRISDTRFFLTSAGLGLKVELLAPATVQAGDEAEVVGFAAMVNGAAVMQSAVCRVVGSGEPPAPTRPEYQALSDGTCSSSLVSVNARLVDWTRDAQGVTLLLQTGNHLFKALLPPTVVPDGLPEKNSIVDVTGICVVSDLEDIWLQSPRSVSLLLTSLDDVQLLQGPPWWTADRLWRALAIALAVLAAGLTWVWSLRGQIQRKGAVIEQQTRHAAVLEERSRIARDLHDTLEQGLTGLSLQLKVVEMDLDDSPEQAARALESARQMLRQSRALAHDAIRELRTDAVARRHETLVGGLRDAAEMWKSFGALSVEFDVNGSERPLPRAIEHHLICIAAEAMTNAVKHGRAALIKLTLRYIPAAIELSVRDDGIGFDPENSARPQAGCFGLLGMRERVQAMSGHITVQSQPGSGTTIRVEIPVGAVSVANSSSVPSPEPALRVTPTPAT